MYASKNRVLSGMRPTGQLHLGHYHGVLKNWVTPPARISTACSSSPTGMR